MYLGWSTLIDPLDVALSSVICTEAGLLCSILLLTAFLVIHFLELLRAYRALDSVLKATPPSGGVAQT